MKCLDTNAIIAVLNNRPPAVTARLALELGAGEEIGVPVIVRFELIYGDERSARREANRAAFGASDFEPENLDRAAPWPMATAGMNAKEKRS